MTDLIKRLLLNNSDVKRKACRPAAEALEAQAERIEELEAAPICKHCGGRHDPDCDVTTPWRDRAERAEADLAAARAALHPRPESEWHEDMGDVLWFHFPIQEPPWVGTPLTSTWIEDWYTHFIPLPNFNEIHDDIAVARGSAFPSEGKLAGWTMDQPFVSLWEAVGPGEKEKTDD
jgi:hypothetical protein